MLLRPTPAPADRAAYRSPEELRGEPADARSDIFAYGALLYELAAGTRAFPGSGSDLTTSVVGMSPAPLLRLSFSARSSVALASSTFRHMAQTDGPCARAEIGY